MDWDKAMETIVTGLILAVIGGIAKVAYDYRKNILLWLKKQQLRLLPINFNVALSVDFKEGLNSGIYYEEIKKNLIRLIDNNGLHNHIKLKDFSDIHKFKDKSDAELFTIKKNIDLIIWGSFTSDGLKKEREPINKVNLNFTCRHPDDKERSIGRMVLLDINSKLALKKYWQITEKNSLNDVEVVSNNIFDIATYILALTLKLYGRIEKSLSLFEHLYNSLSSRQDNFRQHIVPHLINCYELIIIENGGRSKQFDKAKESCKKLLNFKKNNFFALSSLAVFQYKSGEKLEAEKNVELLLKLYPTNPSTEVDVAFFRILQKNYKDAYKYYDRLLKHKHIKFNPQDVIEFLTDAYRLYKDPALLYGSGMISMYFGDRKIAREDLKSFMRKANKETYKLMRKRTEKLLNKIEK